METRLLLQIPYHTKQPVELAVSVINFHPLLALQVASV